MGCPYAAVSRAWNNLSTLYGEKNRGYLPACDAYIFSKCLHSPTWPHAPTEKGADKWGVQTMRLTDGESPENESQLSTPEGQASQKCPVWTPGGVVHADHTRSRRRISTSSGAWLSVVSATRGAIEYTVTSLPVPPLQTTDSEPADECRQPESEVHHKTAKRGPIEDTVMNQIVIIVYVITPHVTSSDHTTHYVIIDD
ncbi:hypothetical protein BaRGS_00019091 [Batillaria attramentaria]|uniref:Uncharacterized protein n=1 Tax=Batillaria attramentaria TaxID=370345 RepID=A0ABD0KRS4_9CAEN